MLSTPLFRIGDQITMRSDLHMDESVHMLCGDDGFDRAELMVMSSDILFAGSRGVVTSPMNGRTHDFPRCHFPPPDRYDGYVFIDETMVEAYRVMQYLNYR